MSFLTYDPNYRPLTSNYLIFKKSDNPRMHINKFCDRCGRITRWKEGRCAECRG
jgi:ribosomal protein L33